MTTKQQETYTFSPEREKRVADALRENLRKRKQRQQATINDNLILKEK